MRLYFISVLLFISTLAFSQNIYDKIPLNVLESNLQFSNYVTDSPFTIQDIFKSEFSISQFDPEITKVAYTNIKLSEKYCSLEITAYALDTPKYKYFFHFQIKNEFTVHLDFVLITVYFQDYYEEVTLDIYADKVQFMYAFKNLQK